MISGTEYYAHLARLERAKHDAIAEGKAELAREIELEIFAYRMSPHSTYGGGGGSPGGGGGGGSGGPSITIGHAPNAVITMRDLGKPGGTVRLIRDISDMVTGLDQDVVAEILASVVVTIAKDRLTDPGDFVKSVIENIGDGMEHALCIHRSKIK